MGQIVIPAANELDALDPVVVNDTRVTAGPPVTYSLGDLTYTYNPGSAPAQTIVLGRRSEFTYSSNFSNSGAGHEVAAFNYFKATGTGNPNLAITTESKFENLNAGCTISTGIGHEVQLASNAGIITTFIGNRSAVVTNAGTIGMFAGFSIDISANAGSIPAVYGYFFPNLAAIPGITVKRCLFNADANAPLQSAAAIADGSVATAAPATGATITIPDNVTLYLVIPAGVLANLTVRFPAIPLPGQVIDFKFGAGVTALVLDGNGAGVFDPVTTVATFGWFTYRYIQPSNLWIRVG